MPGNNNEKRKEPLEVELGTPERWAELGLPDHELIISKPFGKPSETQPPSGTKTSPTGPTPPEPGSKNTYRASANARPEPSTK